LSLESACAVTATERGADTCKLEDGEGKEERKHSYGDRFDGILKPVFFYKQRFLQLLIRPRGYLSIGLDGIYFLLRYHLSYVKKLHNEEFHNLAVHQI
jgi:hypothetical protein